MAAGESRQSFASFPEMILRTGLLDIDPVLKPSVLQNYWLMAHPDQTAIPGLKRLPAAHLLRHRRNRQRELALQDP
ncbi:hypothetical protein [Mameliella alba]|uniref:hypothetical protein n=1 Tax=Mameliella alba TaxID=561184 RepID=UPI000B5380CC|nr:hypothetical protein [Mameliella alba]OWV39229.1 hypothetical protein CDZ95_27325 [Mameliella alba]